jgi:hypothetical protein
MLDKERERLKTKLMKKVDIDQQTGCWNWKGKIDSKGKLSYRCGGKCGYAQRFSFELFIGPIYDPTYLVTRVCGNNVCINPEHLQLSNLIDHGRFDTLRDKRLCKRGHSLDGAYIRTNGTRACRWCCKERTSKRQKQKKYNMVCFWCEKEFLGTYAQLYKGKKSGNNFCSKSCMSKWRWSKDEVDA